MWKIEKTVKKGPYDYAIVRNHPNATKRGYVLMHRVVMENHLGRILDDGEIVHHLDHNGHNNDISNLVVMNGKDHVRMHGYEQERMYATLLCPWCKSIFTRPWNESSNYKYDSSVTFCSSSCRASYERERQLRGISDIERQMDLYENLIGVSRRRTDKLHL